MNNGWLHISRRSDGENTGRYTGHLDTVLALTTYLALTPRKSRTAVNLASDLSLPQNDVQSAFDAFPSIFRKSKNTSPQGAHYYTLTARYALRASDDKDDDADLPDMRSDVLKMLLDFVAQRVEAEASENQFRKNLGQARFNSGVAAVAAIVAAAASIVAAGIGH